MSVWMFFTFITLLPTSTICHVSLKCTAISLTHAKLSLICILHLPSLHLFICVCVYSSSSWLLFCNHLSLSHSKNLAVILVVLPLSISGQILNMSYIMPQVIEYSTNSDLNSHIKRSLELEESMLSQFNWTVMLSRIQVFSIFKHDYP